MTTFPHYEITKTMYNIPIAIYLHKKSPIPITTAHWHRALELSIVFEGKIDFYNGNQHIICQENEVSLTNSEEIHYSIPHYNCFEDKYVGYTMQINYSFLEKLIPHLQKIYFDISNPKINKKISYLMLEIFKLLESKDEVKYIKIYKYVLDIIIILVEKCQNKKEVIVTKKTKDILNYIHLHYQENIFLYEIACQFGFSKEYFSRFFKKEIGIPFKQYLINLRLNKSLELLKNKNLTILEVSIQSGFPSEVQFINSFKKYYHITPGTYRKLNFQYK